VARSSRPVTVHVHQAPAAAFVENVGVSAYVKCMEKWVALAVVLIGWTMTDGHREYGNYVTRSECMAAVKKNLAEQKRILGPLGLPSSALNCITDRS
jgi:hypothetical protein